MQHDTVWPNYRPNPQIDAIKLQYIYALSGLKPRYCQFVVDWYRYGDYDIAVEKLGRLWKIWFYLSLCENATGCQHKLHNPHMHFHSLVHELSGLNENQRLSVVFQELSHIISLWLLSHIKKITADRQKPHGRSLLLTLKPPWRHTDRSHDIMGRKHQKLYRYSNRSFSSNRARSTLRNGLVTKIDCRFLEGWRPFATFVRPN